MGYKDQLAPELKKSARRVPFNRKIVQVGNIYQAAALKSMPAHSCDFSHELAGFYFPI